MNVSHSWAFNGHDIGLLFLPLVLGIMFIAPIITVIYHLKKLKSGQYKEDKLRMILSIIASVIIFLLPIVCVTYDAIVNGIDRKIALSGFLGNAWLNYRTDKSVLRIYRS